MFIRKFDRDITKKKYQLHNLNEISGYFALFERGKRTLSTEESRIEEQMPETECHIDDRTPPCETHIISLYYLWWAFLISRDLYA